MYSRMTSRTALWVRQSDRNHVLSLCFVGLLWLRCFTLSTKVAGHADERSAQSDIPHDSTLVRDSLGCKFGGSGGACSLRRVTALGAASSV